MNQNSTTSNPETPASTASLSMRKNQNRVAADRTAAIKQAWRKYRKPIVITSSVIVLQLIFGFDPKFCIINIIWLFV